MSQYATDNRKVPLNRMLTYEFDEMKLEDAFLGIRVMAFDSYLYKGMRERFRRIFGSAGATILYEMGVGYGEIIGGMIEARGKYNINVYKEFLERGNYHGMGYFSVPGLLDFLGGLRGGIRIKLRQSFFAEAAGKTGECECFIFAGFIAGAAQRLFNRKFRCIEEKSISKNDEYCEFKLKIHKDLDGR